MSYVQLTDDMFAIMRALEDSPKPKTVEQLIGEDSPSQERRGLFKLWLSDMLRVVPNQDENYQSMSVPLHYELTEQGKRKLEKIREGESTNRYKSALDKIQSDNPDAELKIIPDTGHSKRSLVVVMCDGKIDYKASKWAYETGCARRPIASDLDTLLEETN